jgi:hypothetical protein
MSIAYKFATVSLLMTLASCGSVAPDGSVESGPLGQTPLMSQEVQAATRVALNACIDSKTMGVPLSRLTSQGFQLWRSSYLLRIDNPAILAGDSSVSVAVDRQGRCVVNAWPVYPVEVQTMQSITLDVQSARGVNVNPSFSYTTGRGSVAAILQ